ncbi:hypothetical protein FA15DRAFT_678250 [Coprinopsis marcescibilis]|uniref:Peroxisome membrane anchor protein Pex14p N-terminal domain-containing protein n=1 Tax=Coprinopsis marcescibilis TaxID=230819 RepID=A0A5C3L771_COPMA|nr:hypothetical protein FA15DRAFT_678250 [Coprinopsis marcescibilis]
MSEHESKPEPLTTPQAQASNSGPETGPSSSQPGTSNESSPSALTPSTSAPSPGWNVEQLDRNDLLAKARSFLHSAQIQQQDLSAKRRFLAEKGLSDVEVDSLMREQSPVYAAPSIPPRTYPQQHPSNLPVLLLGLARLFSWIGLGSTALIFVYYRFLLPKISETADARHSLRVHHISLMRRLTASLLSLKESQSESLAALPRSDPYHELAPFAQARSLSQTLKVLDKEEPDYSRVPPVTLLRCAIADLSKGKSGDEARPTTEDVFLLLEGQIPWLASVEGYEFKKTIYDTLIACPYFVEHQITPSGSQEPQKTWEYVTPQPLEPSALVKSLDALNEALPKRKEVPSTVFQHALETLTEFTGYISSHVYIPYRPPAGGMGMSNSYGLSPAEDALKKEIRALKGLVLSR